MITPYLGDFLSSPIPLELSMSPCVHSCAYCFSACNRYKGWGGIKGFFRSLDNALTGKTDNLTARLLRDKYPVCVSNRSDPFARNNYKDALQVFHALQANQIPVYIQTKGGVGADEAADFLPPSVWYISITGDDEASARIEPGAPLNSERIAFAKRLTDRGHKVIAAVNPCVPEWISDPDKLVSDLAAAGCSGVWTERMHLHKTTQQPNLPARAVELIGQHILDRAAQKYAPPSDYNMCALIRKLAVGHGMAAHRIGLPEPSGIWDAYRELYPKTFGTNQDFTNRAFAELDDGDWFRFEDWASIVIAGMPEGLQNTDHYIASVCRQVAVPRFSTFRDLLKMIWCDRRIAQCPARIECFSYEVEDDMEVVDDDGLPVMVFNSSGFDDYYVTVDR
jgi:DNA repair photolyase